MKHTQTYWIHRHRQGFYLNAPHEGYRLFYTKKLAKAYLSGPEWEIVRVTMQEIEGKVK